MGRIKENNKLITQISQIFIYDSILERSNKTIDSLADQALQLETTSSLQLAKSIAEKIDHSLLHKIVNKEEVKEATPYKNFEPLIRDSMKIMLQKTFIEK